MDKPPIKNKELFARRLLAVILSRGLDYRDLARRAELPPDKVMKLINGRNRVRPTRREAMELARCLDIDPDWLRGYELPGTKDLHQVYPNTPW